MSSSSSTGTRTTRSSTTPAKRSTTPRQPRTPGGRWSTSCASTSVDVERGGHTAASGSLEPDLDLVAVGVVDVRVRLAWGELAATDDLPAGLLHCFDGSVDVGGSGQPEAEMIDAAALAGALPPFEHQAIPRTGPPHLDLRLVAVVL